MKKIHQTTLKECYERGEFLKWLIGFIEGEGCFTFILHKKRKNLKIEQISTIFQIGLSTLDKEILYKIKKELGMGKIYNHQKKSINGTTCFKSDYKITKVKDLKMLIEILDNFKFYTKKKKDYELWKEGFKLIKEKKHLTREGLNKILNIRKKMNIRANKNEE